MMFVAPYAQLVPLAATAPALILVGALMMAPLADIAWDDPEIAIPAFLTMAMIPLTFSIANGLAFGITAYALLKLLRGRISADRLAAAGACGLVRRALRLAVGGVIAGDFAHRQEFAILFHQSILRQPCSGFDTFYLSRLLDTFASRVTLIVQAVPVGRVASRRSQRTDARCFRFLGFHRFCRTELDRERPRQHHYSFV